MRPNRRLQQIGLFGFGRKAGRRPAALNVANHQRQLDRDGQAERFGFQRHARAGRRGDAKSARIGGADRGRDRSDFVFGLEGDDAEILVHGKLVKNVGRRRNRIRAEEERNARLSATQRRSQERAPYCR